jgi:uncharacterized Zn-binding protein involved in type VI secretion
MSKAVAIVGSEILGETTGEHHGHYDAFGSPIHGSGTLTGTVTSGSDKLTINGVNVAIELSPTSESDNCGDGSGTLGAVQHKLKINGKSVQLVDDATIPHNGTAQITTGDQKIMVG